MDPSPSLLRRLRTPVALALAALALCAPAAAAATTSTSATSKAPVLLARAGSGTSSFSHGRSGYGFGSHRSYRGYRRTGGGSFLHGLFVGWTLGHFFGYGGGIPLFPLLFFLFIFWVMIRGPRRPPPRRRGPWMLR